MSSHPRAVYTVILLVSVCVVYANALTTSFQFDDFNVIVNYSPVHSLRTWFDALPAIRPLLKLSYALNWAIDTGPIGFHLFNLLCHCISALLVFYLGRLLLIDGRYADATALIVALLFALHPAQTEVVTYISGRSVALMGVFYLGALLATNSECADARNLLAPLLFIAALLSKETAWTLPFAALLVYRLRGVTLRESLWHTRPLWIALLAMGFVIVATPAYQRLLSHVFSIRSPLENIALQIDGWWYLLTRPLLLQTNIDPDLPLTPVLDFAWWVKVTALLLGMFWVWRTHSRWLQFALLWFFLHLLPTNSLLPRNDIANDRQLYLALIGPALATGRALLALRAQWVRALLAVTLLALCGAATLLRNLDYRDEVSLWEATTRNSAHKARVWNNLGYAYQLRGDRVQALAAYERALTLDPDYYHARINSLLLLE